MTNRFNALVVFLASIAVVGCATQTSPSSRYAPLTQSARAAITSTKVVVGVDADREQSKWVQQYGGANQAGLLGAIISAVVLNSLESNEQEQRRKAESIRDAAVKFNFASRYRSALEQGLRPLAWLHLGSVTREPVLQREKYRELLESMSDGTLLISDASYDLAADFTTLTVTAFVTLYAKTPAPSTTSTGSSDGSDTRPALYDNRFTFEFVDANSKPSAADWGNNDGAKLAAALQAGIDVIVQMIVLDLQADQEESASFAPVERRGVCTGRILRESDGQATLRRENGELCTSASRLENMRITYRTMQPRRYNPDGVANH